MIYKILRAASYENSFEKLPPGPVVKDSMNNGFIWEKIHKVFLHDFQTAEKNPKIAFSKKVTNRPQFFLYEKGTAQQAQRTRKFNHL